MWDDLNPLSGGECNNACVSAVKYVRLVNVYWRCIGDGLQAQRKLGEEHLAHSPLSHAVRGS
jgi:hypothetical protein